MDAKQIQHAKFLKESGMHGEAAQFYAGLLKQNPSDKTAKLGYAQSLRAQGLKEKLKPLLFRAEKVLYELIKEDYSFAQAHDELIFLSHYLNHMGNISRYYHEKIMQYPDREIYQECLKKVSATAMLTIPQNLEDNKKKKSFFSGILGFQFIIMGCLGVVLSLAIPKFKKLFMPSLVLIIIFIGAGAYSYIKGSKKTQW